MQHSSGLSVNTSDGNLLGFDNMQDILMKTKRFIETAKFNFPVFTICCLLLVQKQIKVQAKVCSFLKMSCSVLQLELSAFFV